ncbi:hypothetical protein GL263_09520, partial [Streptomyces durbertensis]|nr:hypothetical protein [Streptomyces durbertensis]
GERSGTWEGEQAEVVPWMREHTARDPSHRSYREIITRPYRSWLEERA